MSTSPGRVKSFYLCVVQLPGQELPSFLAQRPSEKERLCKLEGLPELLLANSIPPLIPGSPLVVTVLSSS
jgi:hypothetical protein